MSYLIYLKSAKRNLYEQIIHWEGIVTLGKLDRKESKFVTFNKKTISFYFLIFFFLVYLGTCLKEVLNIKLVPTMSLMV